MGQTFDDLTVFLLFGTGKYGLLVRWAKFQVWLPVAWHDSS